MSGGAWTTFEAIVGGAIALVGALVAWPKTRAAARKLNADASQVEWGTLSKEIKRLQERVEAQDKRIGELEKLDSDRSDREAGLKRENYQLRAKVRKLENRIAGLEAIFKLGPPTPEQQALIEQLGEIE